MNCVLRPVPGSCLVHHISILGVRVLSMGIVIRSLLSIACVGILVFQYWRFRENDQKFRIPHT